MRALSRRMSVASPPARAKMSGGHALTPSRHEPNRALGNQGVQRLLAARIVQAKLRVSQPGDAYEVEADRVAEQVMRVPAPGRQGASCAGCDDDAPCPKCAAQRGTTIRRALDTGAAAAQASPSSAASSGLGAGRGLDTPTRAFFEPRFGRDFGGVRVHTDVRAAASAQSLNALAYTYGRDVVFAAGQYAPESARGRRLLAHELAHVVQQADEPFAASTLQRAACPHDAEKGSGCGLISWKGPQSELPDFVNVGTDRIITAVLPVHLGGTWVPQLLSPPIPEKGAKERGFIDAAKVSATANLSVEVLEIKSRNTTMDRGGCNRASVETEGYVREMQPLAPHVVSLAAGLAKVGGLRTDQCRRINAAQKRTLVTAGLDVNNPDSVRAWCLYNDLQNKLNRTFTTGFAKASFSINKDGDAKSDYVVGVIPITCKRGRKTVPGTKKLVFEVNTQGGLSYRCDKRCGDRPEEKKEKEKPKEIEVPADKSLRSLKQPPIDEEYDPYEEGVRLPPSGVDVTDVAIVSTLGVATVAVVHRLLKKKARSEIEKRALKAIAKRTIEEMTERGASQAARRLNSHNLERIGTRAYEAALKKAEREAAERVALTTEEKVAERLATRLGKTAAKKGAKTIMKAAGKALPLIGILLTAKDVLAAADQISKGAQIEIGLGGGETDLRAGTDIKVTGEKPKGGAIADVKTEQTEVDIEMKKIPDVKGLMDLETKQVKIKGKIDGSDGDPVTVNLKVKIENTTIVYRSAGRFKGGNIVVDGGLEITDSQIEIDLPPGAVLDPPKPGEHRVVKGVKVKVTKVGSGTGVPGAEAKEGEGAGGSAAKGKDEKKNKAPPPSAERKKLLGEIQGEPNVKKIYDAVIKPRGIPVSDEVLRRLLALKQQLKQRPDLAERVIKLLRKGEIKDPIKDLIEPMEAEIRRVIQAEAQKKPVPPPPTGGAPAEKDIPEKEAPPPNATQPAPAVDPCKDADKFELWSIVDTASIGKGSFPPGLDARVGEKKFDETVTKPTAKASSPVLIGRKTPGGLRKYTVWVHGNDMKPLKTFDHRRFVWAADYKFVAPSGPFKSEQGDHPICFTDAGVTRRMTWGRLRKTKKKR